MREEIKPILEATGDVCASVATFGKKDEVEVWTGYTVRGEQLTRKQQVAQGAFVYGLPLVGSVVRSLVRNGFKLANAMRRTAKVADDIDGVLKPGLKAGDEVASAGRVAPNSTVKNFDVVDHRPSNPPFENHHGVLDVWAKHNIDDYVSREPERPLSHSRRRSTKPQRRYIETGCLSRRASELVVEWIGQRYPHRKCND